MLQGADDWYFGSPSTSHGAGLLQLTITLCHTFQTHVAGTLVVLLGLMVQLLHQYFGSSSRLHGAAAALAPPLAHEISKFHVIRLCSISQPRGTSRWAASVQMRHAAMCPCHIG